VCSSVVVQLWPGDVRWWLDGDSIVIHEWLGGGPMMAHGGSTMIRRWLSDGSVIVQRFEKNKLKLEK
jgi:hypothetical protein